MFWGEQQAVVAIVATACIFSGHRWKPFSVIIKSDLVTLAQTVVQVAINSNFSSFSRRGPDNVTEELVAVLSDQKPYEFKALFTLVHGALRARNAAGGGEEMLRLRAYEKLQNLVLHGQVKKVGKQYKGVRKGLLELSENLKVQRKGLPFQPAKSASAPKPARKPKGAAK